MQKLGKRIQNGNEDNIYHYTAIIVKKFNEELTDKGGEAIENNSTKKQSNETKITNKPWWKFWQMKNV